MSRWPDGSTSKTTAQRYYRRHRKRCLARTKLWRAKNSEHLREMRVKDVRAHFAFTSKIKLTTGCADCGYNTHPAALDFDHRPGTKKLAQIAAMAGRNQDVILAEIAKCDVVCANCHRIRTFERKKMPKIWAEKTAASAAKIIEKAKRRSQCG